MSMKTRNWVAVLALSLTTLFVACDDDDDVNPEPNLEQTDIDYLNRIAEGNLAQIAWSQIARDSGTNVRVQEFARQLITDHQQLQTSVDSLADAFNVELPSQMDTAQLRFRDSLRVKVRGRAFDTLFMGEQVRLHERMISNLNNASTNAKNSDVKNFASRHLPNVTRHRDTAVVIRNSL